jgi:hypothetical protein
MLSSICTLSSIQCIWRVDSELTFAFLFYLIKVLSLKINNIISHLTFSHLTFSHLTFSHLTFWKVKIFSADTNETLGNTETCADMTTPVVSIPWRFLDFEISHFSYSYFCNEAKLIWLTVTLSRYRLWYFFEVIAITRLLTYRKSQLS